MTGEPVGVQPFPPPHAHYSASIQMFTPPGEGDRLIAPRGTEYRWLPAEHHWVQTGLVYEARPGLAETWVLLRGGEQS